MYCRWLLAFSVSIVVSASASPRVVSGDWAVWTSRGIAGTPTPHDVGEQLVHRVLYAAELGDLASHAVAIAAGLRDYGWAQHEVEPEQTSDRRKVRVWSDGARVTLELLDIADRVVLRAVHDGDTVAVDRPELAPLADRRAQATFSSVENTVLGQEHLQRQFFEEMIDLDYPGLEEVRGAYAAGERARAIYALAEYFRRKTTPAALIQKPTARPETDSHAAGEKVMAHIVERAGKTIAMGTPIVWDRHPEGVDSAEFLWDFNSHGIFVTLLDAYLATANEKYARKYVDLISDFIIQHPAPSYTITRVATWRNLEAGNRATVSWPQAFYGFLSSPNFTPQAIQLVLTGLWDHGRYIYEHPAGLRLPSNWSVVDSSGLLSVALYFPEFRDAPVWREAGFERLQFQLDTQVYPDGAQYELAPGYHIYCMDRFKRMMLLAAEAGDAMPEAYQRGVESMYDYLLRICRPDGTAPAWSDSGPAALRGILAEGARLFGRDDMRYLATGGAEGVPPAFTSIMLPFAGQAIFRNGWRADALYLGFDGGPVGTNHQHEDKLSIVLSAYGQRFLIDPGPHNYTPTPMRKYCVSTAGHSTVLIDGQGQNRIRDDEELLASENPQPVWHAEDGLVYTAASYDSGYGDAEVGVRHTRHVAFVADQFWVLVDELEAEDPIEHTAETLFQFAPEIDVVVREGMVIGMGPAGQVLYVIPSGGANVRLARGEETPRLQGWYAVGGDAVPTTTAIVSEAWNGRAIQAYLLYPAREGLAERPVFDVHRDERKVRMRVDHDSIVLDLEAQTCLRIDAS